MGLLGAPVKKLLSRAEAAQKSRVKLEGRLAPPKKKAPNDPAGQNATESPTPP